MILVQNDKLNHKELGLAVALKHMGMFEVTGERLPEISAQIKALTDEDRQWFREQFKGEYGCTITN